MKQLEKTQKKKLKNLEQTWKSWKKKRIKKQIFLIAAICRELVTDWYTCRLNGFSLRDRHTFRPNGFFHTDWHKSDKTVIIIS